MQIDIRLDFSREDVRVEPFDGDPLDSCGELIIEYAPKYDSPLCGYELAGIIYGLCVNLGIICRIDGSELMDCVGRLLGAYGYNDSYEDDVKRFSALRRILNPDMISHSVTCHTQSGADIKRSKMARIIRDAVIAEAERASSLPVNCVRDMTAAIEKAIKKACAEKLKDSRAKNKKGRKPKAEKETSMPIRIRLDFSQPDVSIELNSKSQETDGCGFDEDAAIIDYAVEYSRNPEDGGKELAGTLAGICANLKAVCRAEGFSLSVCIQQMLRAYSYNDSYEEDIRRLTALRDALAPERIQYSIDYHTKPGASVERSKMALVIYNAVITETLRAARPSNRKTNCINNLTATIANAIEDACTAEYQDSRLKPASCGKEGT